MLTVDISISTYLLLHNCFLVFCTFFYCVIHSLHFILMLNLLLFMTSVLVGQLMNDNVIVMVACISVIHQVLVQVSMDQSTFTISYHVL